MNLWNTKRKNNSSKEAGSRSGRSVSDIKKVNGKLFFIPLISSLILGPIFADPLKNYDAKFRNIPIKILPFFPTRKSVKLNSYFPNPLKIGRRKNIPSITIRTNPI